MQSTACHVATPEPSASEQRPSAVKYGIRHESGAWYNHRLYSEDAGPHVEDPTLALGWESKALAEETAAMLSRGARGVYEVARLPIPAERATWADSQ